MYYALKNSILEHKRKTKTKNLFCFYQSFALILQLVCSAVAYPGCGKLSFPLLRTEIIKVSFFLTLD